MTESYAIDTLYNGYTFRSRLEARWAIFFDNMNMPYLYEPEGFDLDGVRYLPDFYLKNGIRFLGEEDRLYSVWVEIKPGTDLSEEDRQKIAAFVRKKNSILLLVTGDPAPEAEVLFIAHAANGGEWSTLSARWLELANEELGLLNLGNLNESVTPDAAAALKALTKTPRLMTAFSAARGARFEYGAEPAGQHITLTKVCKSCGKPFRPIQNHHPLCYACFFAQNSKEETVQALEDDRATLVPVPVAESVEQTSPSKLASTVLKNKRIYSLAVLAAILVLLAVGFVFTSNKGNSAAVPPAVPTAVGQPLLSDEPQETPTQKARPEATLVPARSTNLRVVPVCDCSRNIYDCKDFDTHVEAQACFEFCFKAQGDIHYLDGNEDGQACVTLP